MQILNPWPGLQARPYTDVRSITIRIPRQVAEDIEKVYGGSGYTSGVVHTILKAIHDNLRTNNIISYNPEHLLAIVQRLSTALSAGDVAYSNVPGATQGVHSGAAQVPSGSNTEGKGNRSKGKVRRRTATKGSRSRKGSSDT